MPTADRAAFFERFAVTYSSFDLAGSDANQEMARKIGKWRHFQGCIYCLFSARHQADRIHHQTRLAGPNFVKALFNCIGIGRPVEEASPSCGVQ